ncbi:hypothetical protein ACFVH6_22295 [Spirillospora sp. NPDC127200]
MSGPWSRQERKTWLLTLAYQQVSFPHLNVKAEVAEVSSIADDEARDIAFTALCEAVKLRDQQMIDDILRQLTSPGLAVRDEVAVLPKRGAA